MTTIREIITKWSFQSDHSQLDQIEHQLEGIHHTLEFLAATEIVKGIYELTERFAHFAEELHVAAQSAGITVEAFQKLSFAAQQSSISSEEMGMGMARLARHLYDARNGSQEAAQAFAQAGFNQQQIASFKTGQDALLALADKMRAIQDPIKKQALAMTLLGRGSVHMVGFLSQGSAAIKGMGDQAEKLGIILNEQQVEALVKVEHALQRLWGVAKAFGATMASYFAPSIEYAIDSFLKFYEANRKLIDLNVRQWVWDITYALGFIWAAVKYVTQGFLDFAAAHPLLVRRGAEVIAGLVLMAGAIFAINTALGLVKTVLEPALSIFGGFGKIAWWLGKTVLPYLIPVLTTVWELFSGLALTLVASPIGALAAIVVLLHDAYVLLFGSGKWEDTWLGKAFMAIKGFGGKIVGGIEGMLGIGGAAGTPPSAGASISTATSSNSNNSVVAPVTFNLPSAMDPSSLLKQVKEGVKAHLDQQNRETNRSFTPSIQY